MIDSREFINARRRADAQVLLPKGTRIAFAGGVDCNDHQRIWAVLDKVQAKHSDMVLLHGRTPRGAEKIAACWADARKVSQVVFKPDWTRHQKAAPFKRNDQLLEAMPIGIVLQQMTEKEASEPKGPQEIPGASNDNGTDGAPIDPRILIVARALGRLLARQVLEKLRAANDNESAKKP